MRPLLVVGNWKMHGSLSANASLLGGLRAGWAASDVRAMVVCVPYPYLAQAQAELAGSAIAWGAQDVSEHPSGAFTGEVSAEMLADFNCRYAIVGHSERRTLYGDTDALVASKAAAAHGKGLTPIVCVGETLPEREADATDAVVTRQLDAVIGLLGEAIARVVVAYEPVWAIGTGRTAAPEQVQAVHRRIRQRLEQASSDAGAVRVIYGGSVKADSAKALFAMPDVDGGLVGGASLKAGEFLAIARA